MKLRAKIELLKFCSALLNFILMVLGLSVAACGLWILLDLSFISIASSDDLRLVAVAILSVGGLVVVVSILGLVGALKEIRVLLLPVGALLLLLVLAQVFIFLLLIINKNQISQTMMEAVDELIRLYPTGQGPLLDTMQHYAQCCGRLKPSDWLKNQFVQSLNESKAEILPCSCFSSSRHPNGTFCSENQTLLSESVQFGNGSYSTGCGKALSHWLQENLITIMGMDLGLILIQVLQMVLVVTLFRSFKVKSSVKTSVVDVTEPDQDQEQDQDLDLDLDYRDQDYRDQDLLYEDLGQGLYHGPYDGPYEDRDLYYSKY